MVCMRVCACGCACGCACACELGVHVGRDLGVHVGWDLGACEVGGVGESPFVGVEVYRVLTGRDRRTVELLYAPDDGVALGGILDGPDGGLEGGRVGVGRHRHQDLDVVGGRALGGRGSGVRKMGGVSGTRRSRAQ